MERIGITGANGFIGAHLLRSAVAQGLRPVAFLQRESSLHPIADLEGKYDAAFGDLLDAESVAAFAGKCDAIFHLAALNRYWVKDRSLFHRTNVTGVENIAKACVERGVRKLVHTSSCVTLGASDTPSPRNEDSPYNLEGLKFLYADTKRAGEEAIKRWTRERALPAVIVNPTSAIGEQDHVPTPIGKPIADIARGVWPVYVAGGASFIDVHDVVRALWLAFERGKVGRQYLLVGENLSNQEFMTKVADVAGVARPRFKAPKALLDLVGAVGEWTADHFTNRDPLLTSGTSGLIGKYLYFDGARAREELGFMAGPVVPAIERCLRWFRSR